MRKSVLLVVVLAALFGVLYFLSRDVDPPDDQHLVLEERPMPTDTNGYVALLKLLEDIDWPDDDAWVRETPRSEISDHDAIVDLIASNRAVLDRLPAVVTAPDFRVPSSTELDPPELIPRLRRLGQLVTLSAALQMSRGEELAALEFAFQYLALGHRFHGTGELLYYFIGTSHEALALQEIVRLASQSSGAGLDGFARRVHLYAWEPTAMANALRREYMFMTAMVDEPFQQSPGWADVPGFGRYLYQPNHTKQLFADSFTEAIDGLSMGCADAPRDSEPVTMPKWRYLGPNSMGRILHAVGSPNLDRFTLSRCREQMSIDLTELVLALHAYRASEGELPRSLDALVPSYLDVLPVDVDGNEFRYSANDAYLYSVGEDRLDQGGGEPSFRIVWQAPDPGVSLRP